MPVTMHQAKTHFSKLVAQAERGEEVIVSRGNTPVVKIVAINPPEPVVVVKKPRVPGRLEHLVGWSDAFFDPLPDDELALWNGEGD